MEIKLNAPETQQNPFTISSKKLTLNFVEMKKVMINSLELIDETHKNLSDLKVQELLESDIRSMLDLEKEISNIHLIQRQVQKQYLNLDALSVEKRNAYKLHAIKIKLERDAQLMSTKTSFQSQNEQLNIQPKTSTQKYHISLQLKSQNHEIKIFDETFYSTITSFQKYKDSQREIETDLQLEDLKSFYQQSNFKYKMTGQSLYQTTTSFKKFRISDQDQQSEIQKQKQKTTRIKNEKKWKEIEVLPKNHVRYEFDIRKKFPESDVNNLVDQMQFREKYYMVNVKSNFKDKEEQQFMELLKEPTQIKSLSLRKFLIDNIHGVVPKLEKLETIDLSYMGYKDQAQVQTFFEKIQDLKHLSTMKLKFYFGYKKLSDVVGSLIPVIVNCPLKSFLFGSTAYTIEVKTDFMINMFTALQQKKLKEFQIGLIVKDKESQNQELLKEAISNFFKSQEKMKTIYMMVDLRYTSTEYDPDIFECLVDYFENFNDFTELKFYLYFKKEQFSKLEMLSKQISDIFIKKTMNHICYVDHQYKCLEISSV